MLDLKHVASICLALVFAIKARTQISMPYTMGVVGNAGQTENVFSGSILFDSERCFLLSMVFLLAYTVLQIYSTLIVWWHQRFSHFN